ncbi:MAG: coiled-coil domain-containing protein [Mediterraneibacter sp.]
MKLKRMRRACIAALLACTVTVTPVSAAPDTLDDIQNQKDNLEDQKTDAQNELSSLQEELNTLISKAAELEDKLISTGQEISRAEEDLSAAEEKKDVQYESMKLRIKYMYESGGSAADLEKIFSSGDITSMLAQAEYAQRVHEYDRQQLQEYVDTITEIEELQDTLQTEMANLESLEAEYETQQEQLNTTISSKKDDISNLDEMIRDAAKKYQEEQERQAAEEARQQAAAQAQAQQEAEADDSSSGNSTASNSGGSSGGGTTTGGSGSGNSGNSSNSGGSSGGSSSGGSSSGGSSNSTPSYDSSTGNAVVDRAYSKLGLPYKWGAAGPNSFDCSGLVSYALSGKYVHTYTTYDFITWPQVSDPQPGDICTTVTHCGIYIGNGQMIHAPQTGDVVKISPVRSNMIFVRRP